MIAFLIRKIFSSLLTLFVLTTIVFFVVQVLMPGDFVSQFLGMPVQEKERLRQELGLDLPIWDQYLRWMGGLLTGQSHSFFGTFSVMDTVASALPPTLLVFVVGGGIAILLGYWLGKNTGWRSPRWLSEGTALFVIGLYAFFPPALAFLLQYFLGRQLEWLPANSEAHWARFQRDFPTLNQVDIMSEMVIVLAAVVLAVWGLTAVLYRWRRMRLPASITLSLVLISWLASLYARGIGAPALRVLYIASIPILAFMLLTVGELTIITRTSLAETVHEEYITTARAKGIPEAAVRDRHAARNALLPVISRAIVSLPYLIAGLAVVEYSLQWRGLGSAVFGSTLRQDVPLALGYLLFIGVLAMGARLLLEVLYFYLDPRLRSGQQSQRMRL
ncbi:MAG: ABC transporter permease [Anaerolineales bacterium]